MNEPKPAQVCFGFIFMDCQIIRSSRRRTLQVRVGVNGVHVSAPVGMPDRDIQDFLLRKDAWIRRALEEIRGRSPGGGDVFVSGGILYVQGDVYHLECIAEDAGSPWLEDFQGGWKVKGTPADRRRLITKWYRLTASKVFPKLVTQWAGRMGLPVPGVVVKDQERLWGSYSARSRCVQLNWRMMAFPLEIMEYVVIHELSHVRRMDHSPAFWHEVFRYCPDWRARRLWLRTDAQKYMF
ncbi:MAG: SprT family zinc-dependent metalloprotease [Candidatus Omnitrophota bacterium]